MNMTKEMDIILAFKAAGAVCIGYFKRNYSSCCIGVAVGTAGIVLVLCVNEY